MKIEIVAFYPMNTGKIGSLHIRLPEIGIDIRGIHVHKHKKHIVFRLPFQSSPTDKKLNGKPLEFLICSFFNPETQAEFFKTLVPLAKNYILQNFKEHVDSYVPIKKPKYQPRKPSFNPKNKPDFSKTKKNQRESVKFDAQSPIAAPKGRTHHETENSKARAASKFEKPPHKKPVFQTYAPKKNSHPFNFSSPPARKTST